MEQRKKNLIIMEQELEKKQKAADKLTAQIDTIGPVGEREDRDFRKQLIMTTRTLFLQNCLMVFLTTWLELAEITMGIDNLIEMLFSRTGSYIETNTAIIYQVNLKGLASPYRGKMQELMRAYNDMELSRDGKPIQLKMRDGPL